MNTLVSRLTEEGYADRIVNDRQLARLLGGSDDRRYGQVKRALKSGGLIQLKRGFYVLSQKYRTHPVHPFALAHTFIIGSYISMETALSFHGWIPEAVYTTVSITPGRKSKQVQHNQFGKFEFNPLAVNKPGFLSGVERHILDNQPVLIATPLRALMDIVAYRKQSWVGINWIESGLRIDLSYLLALRRRDFKGLEGVYQHKKANLFLTKLEAEVFDLKSNPSVAEP